MADPALIAHGLSKTFGAGELAVVAVHDVELTLSRGEVVLIMGPSGSGKTTLPRPISASASATGSTFSAARSP